MRLPFFTILACAMLILCGCANTMPRDEIDPAGNLTREDYLSLRERGTKNKAQLTPLKPGATDKGASIDQAGIPPVPDLPKASKPVLSSHMTAEKESSKLPTRRVNLTLTESMPLRDALIELGRESGANMEIDPRIEGGLIFTATNQPFDLVLRRLCDMAGLRYRMDEGFIRIEIDEPFQETYTLNYPNLTRRATSEVSISTNVFEVDGASGKSSGGNQQTGSNDNNSTAKIAAKAETDFWSEVEKSLPQVLATATRKHSPVLAQKNAEDKINANFSLDKQAGLVTVFGNAKQQYAVQTYIRHLARKASAQVLIEARIVEVELADQFQSGINWSTLLGGSLDLAADFGTIGAGAAMTTASTGLFSAALDTDDLTGLLKLVRTFGATRVLSSPRLTVMNNQTAVLKVARNEVYFLTSAEFPTTTNSNGTVVSGTPVFTSTPHTVPVGLVMTVQPAINEDTGRVTLTLRPTISRVVDRVNDPSIGLNAAYSGNDSTVESEIPVLAVREMDSVLQIQSGEVAIMGGLMQDSSQNQDQGIPGFDTLPVVGNLAKARDNNGKTSELVILLRATILDNPRPDGIDANLYEKFTRDPRPFSFPPT